MKAIYLFCLIVFSLSCTSSTDFVDETENPTEETPETPTNSTLYFPPINSENWETATPESLGWHTENIDVLDEFLEQSGTKAFIILSKGKIILEKYYNNSEATDNLPWNSAGKALTAFSTLQAAENNLIHLDDPTTNYLGAAWTNMTPEQEQNITIRHQMTMTSGGDFTVENTSCTDPECLNYLNDPDTNWYYHNAFYSLLQQVLNNAIPDGFDSYFETKLKNKIGMNGAWIQLGYVRVYFSTARSMARFGLLNLSKGIWDTEELLSAELVTESQTSSQDLNPAYGYLWWLNGKSNYKLPTLNATFNGELIPNAPADLVAGLGKNDQKLYVVPSKDLVIVRMGDASDAELQGPSGYDNELWEKLNLVFGD
ncbi:serine hydrolase domain-containing protein [Croceibacter atlanticus]|uniref:serine hydrolase domain-containing protein n=1 Tax=Croceibacter atlanticus TaxID=313588 RepID=UPI0030DA113F|tara:strand:+ start:194714 stop:195823 length:1110 start_codon:yes stop_codon:yes gene_type:complete